MKVYALSVGSSYSKVYMYTIVMIIMMKQTETIEGFAFRHTHFISEPLDSCLYDF